MTRPIDPVAIIESVCRNAGSAIVMNRIGSQLAQAGIVAAVADRDSSALFDWLMGQFSYQGISDTVAATYIAGHGNVTYRGIEEALAASPCPCPLLTGFADYRHCGFSKTERTCSRARLMASCPVPNHDLRKGTSINSLIRSSSSFAMSAAATWPDTSDRALEASDRPGHPDRIARTRAALVEPLRRVHGISDKLINMAFADLLLADDPSQCRWVEVGGSMIAVDTLVHNLLVRTGILDRFDAPHEFGPGCYRERGCALIIDRIARQIDASGFDRSFPVYFPRFIQHSRWAFCAQQGRDICNGNRIDDSARCALDRCPVRPICGRVALKASPQAARARPAPKPQARPPPT